VFTREKLMELVWDAPEASMDRTVDAHIKNIRIKLKAINAQMDPIVTHRGTGYALRDDL
jgi:two-component system catabolic regulation response regulator CreB